MSTFRNVLAHPSARFVLGVGLPLATSTTTGALDAVIVAQNEPLIYLHNRTNNHDHFITILLEGTTSNRDGVGARITAIAGGRRQVAQRFGGDPISPPTIRAFTSGWVRRRVSNRSRSAGHPVASIAIWD